MVNQVKIITDRFDSQKVVVVKKYLDNLRKIIGNEIEVTVLDSNYDDDYDKLVKNYEDISRELPGIKINNFYLSLYLCSNKKNNINEFTKKYIGNEKYTSETTKTGQKVFLQNGQVRIAIITDKNNKITAVDFFKPKQKLPHQRAFVNTSGNIQVIRQFGLKKDIPVSDEYVNTELNTELILKFDKKGLCSSYQLFGWKEKAVYSEIDMYDQWFDRTIKRDDYVINMNRHFDVIFKDKHNANNLFLM